MYTHTHIYIWTNNFPLSLSPSLSPRSEWEPRCIYIFLFAMTWTPYLDACGIKLTLGWDMTPFPPLQHSCLLPIDSTCVFLKRKMRSTGSKLLHTQSVRLFPGHCYWASGGWGAPKLYIWQLRLPTLKTELFFPMDSVVVSIPGKRELLFSYRSTSVQRVPYVVRWLSLLKCAWVRPTGRRGS